MQLTPEQETRSALLKRYKGYAEDHSAFCAKWLPRLLLQYAPMVEKLNDRQLTKQLGAAIVSLCEPWQPSMNHLDKCERRFQCVITDQILVELLVEDIGKAKKRARV